ncbi:disease resistance protein RPS2-like isoform X1 [Dioscorea cayenensis subsp. rotundata]|uniref:Disease resistance protein RPS2-like isoform X1 n=1 Tax=Dioscorea cayennensis subsp. rotundata TaxID=55577 RepID=A0AB40AP39_DIOCR|nr:disease resistance protein RPS2-like isoform X1 [Dioscorea cayenensis subsp. rotundata]
MASDGEVWWFAPRLIVFGKAMSNKKTVDEWRGLLTSLRQSNIKVVQGVKESLFPFLKFSYDNLPGNVKKCFLFTSMLQGKSNYELLESWMGLGLLSDFVNLQEAYEEAKSILKILEESCLLYFSDYGDVHLHDVIYDMAMWIASDCGWIVQKYDGSAEISTNDTENWRDAKQVIIDGIKLLPVLSHQCSDLLSLMIANSHSLEIIPKGFSLQVPNLKYLDLSRSGIKELPKDIKCLVNLQYLNVSCTGISSLPMQLVSLNKLQYLICRDLIGLGKIKDGIISKLHRLKVVDLYPHGWVEPKELEILKKHIKAIGMRVSSQEVLEQLSCLPTTQLYIENLEKLISLSFDTLSCKNQGSLHELKIRSCPQLKEIVMNGSGTHLNNLTIYDIKKLQCITWGPDISPAEYFHVLKKLFICECNLASFAWVLHLPCLSHLRIQNCAVKETLFYVEDEREMQQVLEGPVFPRLENLELTMLERLVSISNFALNFPRLSLLSVHECPNLKKLPFKHGINNSQIINIDCDRKWWKNLEWDDATIPSHLSPTCQWYDYHLYHYVPQSYYMLDLFSDENTDACTIS